MYWALEDSELSIAEFNSGSHVSAAEEPREATRVVTNQMMIDFRRIEPCAAGLGKHPVNSVLHTAYKHGRTAAATLHTVWF